MRPDGSAHFCCDVPSLLEVNGQPGNISRDSLDDLWNADELVQIRSAMARGEKPASCSACWKQEARGVVSRRLLMNPGYRAAGGGLAIEQLPDEGATTGFRLERRPDWFIFELGNVCNLKCRSCNPVSSSRVAADRVQVAWTGPAPALGVEGPAWYKQIDKLVEMIAAAGHEKAMLSLIGGEPFLIESTWRLLEELVDRGVAPSIYVGLLTNGQQRSARLEGLAPHFRGFNVSVSIDGYGKLNDYLRHGADWSKLVDTLDWLRATPKVDVAIVPTLQNGNALDMTALLRFLDERDLPLAYNVLNEPARLRPANLPPIVRRIAARRLRAYLDTECKPVNRGIVRAYCEIIEEPGDAFDPVLFREFLTFTNDLDADRGENLREAAPDLIALIRAAGVEWPDDRRDVAPAAVRWSFDPTEAVPPRPAVQHDVSVIALYDPRCYAPSTPEEGDHAASTWARLTAGELSVPLPTELGFGDPRVAELRETQAALAREHGVDAFCYQYAWGSRGPRWGAAFHDLVTSGRPNFPFCVMIVAEDGTLIGPEAAEEIFDDIADALADRRYVRVEGRPIVVVRDLASLAHARVVAATWRRAAARAGIGELHLSALQPPDAVSPQDMGFDSFVEAPESAGSATATVASLVAPWPAYRSFRSVRCRRDAADPRAGELYEFGLYSAIDATRRRGEKLVFVDAWNDWVRGHYLEPDDSDGRAALLATRRAARGPASGLVLLRRLREALGAVVPSASAVLDELEHVVSVHELTRDRLLAAVEAVLGRARPPVEMPPSAVPFPLPSLSRHAYLDRVAGVEGAALASGPIVLRGDELRVTGWAHVGDHAPAAVEIFLALDAFDGGTDQVFRVDTRVARPEVVATFPDYPPNCGFEVVADISGLPPGMYRLAIVQRTPDARYRDATAVLIKREEASCSTD